MRSGLGTRAVWAGEDGKHWERATQIPVALSVSFGYEDVNEWLAVAQGALTDGCLSHTVAPPLHLTR